MLHIYGRRFEVVGADRRVIGLLDKKELPPLPTHVELSLRNHFRDQKKREEE